MMFFLIAAPYATFAGLSYVTSQTLALLAGAVAALALIVGEHMLGRSTKLLNLTALAMLLTLG